METQPLHIARLKLFAMHMVKHFAINELGRRSRELHRGSTGWLSRQLCTSDINLKKTYQGRNCLESPKNQRNREIVPSGNSTRKRLLLMIIGKFQNPFCFRECFREWKFFSTFMNCCQNCMNKFWFVLNWTTRCQSLDGYPYSCYIYIYIYHLLRNRPVPYARFLREWCRQYFYETSNYLILELEG